MIPTDEMVALIEHEEKRNRWKRVEDMCKDHFHSIEVEGKLIDWLDDDIHYIFEAAMEATFGKGIWPTYNTLNSENSNREQEKFRRQTLNSWQRNQ